MLNYTKEELLELGAEITTREIYQQPDVWKEAFEAYQAKREEIAAFLQGIADKHDYIKVILTGAGTSAYVEIPWYHTLRKSMMNANGISMPLRQQISLPIQKPI